MSRLIWSIFCDALFPIVCRQCGSEGHWLCRLPVWGWVLVCFACRQPMTPESVCACAPVADISGCWYLADYGNDKDITTLWHDVKYAHGWQATSTVMRLIPECCPQAAPVTIIPVPLHPWRHRQRGFNQAEVIATRLSVCGWGRVSTILERVRATPAQQRLNRMQRLGNVRDAFWCPSPAIVGLGPHIMLVDDVWTTGATLEACATALRQAGYTGRIDAAVLFRD